MDIIIKLGQYVSIKRICTIYLEKIYRWEKKEKKLWKSEIKSGYARCERTLASFKQQKQHFNHKLILFSSIVDFAIWFQSIWFLIFFFHLFFFSSFFFSLLLFITLFLVNFLFSFFLSILVLHRPTVFTFQQNQFYVDFYILVFSWHKSITLTNKQKKNLIHYNNSNNLMKKNNGNIVSVCLKVAWEDIQISSSLTTASARVSIV